MSDTRLDERLALAVIGPPMEYDDDRLRKTVDGKVVVVTGASFGQGEATARLLAANGAIVVMAARTLPRLKAIAAEITRSGGVAYAYPLDLCDTNAVDAPSPRRFSTTTAASMYSCSTPANRFAARSSAAPYARRTWSRWSASTSSAPCD
ncbi:MAG: SDR family NAD(P)-dependent oxidoreductase [Gemmatales bacterium]